MSDPVHYDGIAADYDGRYERNDYTGIEHALAAFVGPAASPILEVGCGTGHWLRFLRSSGIAVVGFDPSPAMLQIARTRLGDARLVRARAEALPCVGASFDRIFCINVLHHVQDRRAFMREARRALREGGGLLTIGLDPHDGRDRWWVYDYFPSALAADRQRYLPLAAIRALMQDAGFSRCETREVQHIPAQMTVSEAARRGFLARTSTSQLMVIPEAEYEAGIQRIHADGAHEQILRVDLRVYGTTGWL